jgi:AraC-like DNA-binding protein
MKHQRSLFGPHSATPIDLALQLLKSDPDRPIADIAAALGFVDQSYLTLRRAS